MRLKKGAVLLAGMVILLMTGGCGREKSWEKHITEETVYIEGLEGEYTLLFLTDTHVVVKDGQAAGQEAENEAARYLMMINEEGISAAEQFPEWIQYANNLEVDAVLLGGDIIDTPSRANLQWLEEQLSQLKMPYLYVPGNHDWNYPWEYMTKVGRATYLPLLEPFMQGNTAVQLLDLGEFYVLGIDDSSGQVDREVLSEYEQLLTQGCPVIVAAHVPFSTQSVLGKAKETWDSPVVIGAGAYGGIYPDEYSEEFMKKITAADSPVELILAGHVHFYDRDFVWGEKEVLQLVGGAGYQGNAILIHITGEENHD